MKERTSPPIIPHPSVDLRPSVLELRALAERALQSRQSAQWRGAANYGMPSAVLQARERGRHQIRAEPVDSVPERFDVTGGLASRVAPPPRPPAAAAAVRPAAQASIGDPIEWPELPSWALPPRDMEAEVPTRAAAAEVVQPNLTVPLPPPPMPRPELPLPLAAHLRHCDRMMASANASSLWSMEAAAYGEASADLHAAAKRALLMDLSNHPLS